MNRCIREAKQARQELLEYWSTLDKRLWLSEILSSKGELVSELKIIRLSLEGEFFWRLLLLVHYCKKIKSKIRVFKEIYLMKKCHTFFVADRKYKLYLNLDTIMQIEEHLDKPTSKILKNIYESNVEAIVTIIWGAAQAVNRGFSYEKAMQLFDDYIDEGYSIEELIIEINALFDVSGLFKKGQG